MDAFLYIFILVCAVSGTFIYWKVKARVRREQDHIRGLKIWNIVVTIGDMVVYVGLAFLISILGFATLLKIVEIIEGT